MMNTIKTHYSVKSLDSYIVLLFILLATFCFPLFAEGNIGIDAEGDPTANTTEGQIERYILKYKVGKKDAVVPLIARHGGEILLTLDKHRLFAVNLFPHLIERLSGFDDIEFIEVDAKNYFFAETTPYGIPMVQANAVGMIEAPNTDRKVCIIDSGFELGHEDLPDLQSGRITGDDEIIDANGNITFDTGNWFEDEVGHGSMLAGVIAAIGGNGIGVRGVNAGDKLLLHIVKVFKLNNPGVIPQVLWFYTSNSIVALDQCIAAGSHIVNMSYGRTGFSIAENQALIAANQAGVLLIAASGNTNPFVGHVNRFPASSDAVMSVGSVDSNEVVNSNSVSTLTNDISAPGTALSTMPLPNVYGATSIYHTNSTPGTSISAAYVSGVAALVWGHYPNCSSWQIWRALGNTAKDKGVPGKDIYYGHGIVQAKAAFDAIAASMSLNGTCNVPPPPLPLQNGVVQNSLIAAANHELNYVLDVSSGSTPANPAIVENLNFTLSGGTGDADMYVKFGSRPSMTDYDCVSNNVGNNELCAIANPQEGEYFVMVRSDNLFYGVSLLGNYTVTNIQPTNFNINNTNNNSVPNNQGVSAIGLETDMALATDNVVSVGIYHGFFILLIMSMLPRALYRVWYRV